MKLFVKVQKRNLLRRYCEAWGGCQKILMLRKYVLYKKIMIETDFGAFRMSKSYVQECTFKFIVQENTLVHSKLFLSA